MPCFSPLLGVRADSNSPVKIICRASEAFVDAKFVPTYDTQVNDTLLINCGQCLGCRLRRARDWSLRCIHEASFYSQNSFITLTYNDDNLPYRNSLDYSYIQKWLKRLRKYVGKIRYYVAGEYGSEFQRPHWHAIVFGWSPSDMQLLMSAPSGNSLYRSATLEKTWQFGYSSIGAVTRESAGYVARYCLKKINGQMADDYYRRVDENGEVYYLEPELSHMSLKPGIGAKFWKKYYTDIYPHDFVVHDAKKYKPPKYYDKLLEKNNGMMYDDVVYKRYLNSVYRRSLPQPSLDQMSEVAEAKVKQFGRSKMEAHHVSSDLSTPVRK